MSSMLRRIRSTATNNSEKKPSNNKGKGNEEPSLRKKKKKKAKKSKKQEKTLPSKDEDEPMSKQISVVTNLDPRAELARPFVEATVKKGVMGLIQEFRKMKRTNDYTKMTEFVSQNETGRNRYKDVGCLDHSRVVLTMGSVPYIHANFVDTPNSPHRFICTQAPLPTTCAEFWYMVVQEQCTIVLMLCNFIEMGTKKCAEYFPKEIGTSVNFNNGEVVVTSKASEQHQFNIKTKTKLMVSTFEVVVTGQPPHICTHYHWLDWPDRGVPEADLSPFTLLGLVKNFKSPVIVHCSAGIGRTGAIVLLEHVMDLLHNNVTLGEMKDYLLQLRTQRNNSVQTEHQYLYVHQVLLLYLKATGCIDPTNIAKMPAFTKEYKKATSSSQ